MDVLGLVLWSSTIALGVFDLLFTDRMVKRNERLRKETFDRYGEGHRGWTVILRFMAPNTHTGVRWHGLFLVVLGLWLLLGQALLY